MPEQELLSVFGPLVVYLSVRDVSRLRLASRALCAAVDSDEVWRSLSVRDFGCAPPSGPGAAKRAYRFLSLFPRPGELFEVNLAAWTVVRTVLRLDDRHVLAVPTNGARRAYGQFVWLDTVEDCERVRPIGEASAIAHASSGRAEQRALFDRSQRLALEKLAAGPTPQWPVWDGAMFGLSEYRGAHGYDPFEEDSPVWCALPVEIASRPQQRYLKDTLWREMQVPCRLLRTSYAVMADPQVGELLQVLDGSNKWYSAMITAHTKGTAYITVTYEGWGPEWNETVNIYVAAHRLRAFGEEHVEKGPGEGFQRDTLPRALFLPWDDFLRSPFFVPLEFAPELLTMIGDPEPGALLEVLNPRNEPYCAEIVSITGCTMRVRYDGLEATEDLHIVRDRHRMRPVSIKSLAGDAVPLVDRMSRKRLELTEQPFVENLLADTLYPF